MNGYVSAVKKRGWNSVPLGDGSYYAKSRKFDCFISFSVYDPAILIYRTRQVDSFLAIVFHPADIAKKIHALDKLTLRGLSFKPLGEK